MKSILSSLLLAFMRKPTTTDAIVTGMIKTVTKLEKHAEKSNAKSEATFDQINAMFETANVLLEESRKAQAIAKNLGALLK